MAKISPLSIYKYLPKTNCGKCGEKTCIAFASQLIERRAQISNCPEFDKPEYRQKKEQLVAVLQPPVKAIIIGREPRQVVVGGEEVLHRHELTYRNKTAIGIDVTDSMDETELKSRLDFINNFSITRIGESLTIDLIAIRNVSKEKGKFADCVKYVDELGKKPMVLCSTIPKNIGYALENLGDKRPLIYAATEENWPLMSKLAIKYDCPLVVLAPGDLDLLRKLANLLEREGCTDLLLDPGTFYGQNFSATVSNFVKLRRSAIEGMNDIGYPLVGTPWVIWTNESLDFTAKSFLESIYSSVLIDRYASLLLLHTIHTWALLPIMTLRQNIYTDPRKPVAVKPGLRIFGKPTEKAPVFITANFALTYYTVEGDIQSGKVDCYLLVLDTEGIGVEASVAGGQFSAEKVKFAIKDSGIESKVTHRKLIIPALAARLKGEIEDLTGWEVIVGGKDSSEIPEFIKKKWTP
jgi:acetyl-CoA decarbonylase/synthase complex subunit gamma